MKVLLIDDDPGMAALLARALKRLGHEVVVGHSAHDAVRSIADGADMVIVDGELAEMDAVELIAVLRGIAPQIGVAFVSSSGDGRLPQFGAVLPRVWTVVQLKELLAQHEKARARGSQPTFTAAGPMLTSPPPEVVAEPVDGRMPSRKVRVQCRSWEQVSRLCAQHASGKTVLTLRGPYRFAQGEMLVVALALPDELVLALRAECTHVRRDRDGAEIFGITLHGLTDEIRDRLERMVAAASTGQLAAPVKRAPTYLTS